MRKKASMNLMSTSIFAVFIVIFVILVSVAVMQSRTAAVSVKAEFDYYHLINTFMLNILSDPACIAVGDYENASWQTTTQSLLDSKKIGKLDMMNQDIYCIENPYFLYTVRVLTPEEGGEWVLGLTETEALWADRIITRSVFGSVMHGSPLNISLAEVVLTAYIGEIPRFYGIIKQSCNSGETFEYELSSDYAISYNPETNSFCIGQDCFFAYFACQVEGFELPRGEHLIRINYKNNQVFIQ